MADRAGPADPPGRRRRWLPALGSVRVRTTLGSVVVVGVVLAVSGFLLVRAVERTLDREVRDAALQRAEDAAQALESGTDPNELAVADDVLVQVLDGDGDLVGSNDDEVDGPAPAIDLEPGESAEVEMPFDDDLFLAVAVGADTDAGPRTVVVARTLETATEATETVSRLLTLGLPVVLLLVGVVMWRVVGRALAPVEAIRQEVDAISAAELHRRVPAPTGRDEVARLAGTMNRMLDRLQQAQARQRRFISDASHELRSPVASIRQHAEVALAHPEHSSLADLAENVLAEDLRVQRLVEDLLLLARADEEGLSPHLVPVDLDDLVFEEARLLSSGFRVDTTGVSAGRVAGDAGLLRRVLRNLGTNAARHAEAQVAFGLAQRDGQVILTVDDDGPGIPVSQRDRVFERFVRLDEARARARDGDGGGAGLGLAIVAELVAAHGGTVSLEDSPLGGTRARVVLPSQPVPRQ